MCYDNDCVLNADHEGSHTDGEGAWIDGGKPVVRRLIKTARTIRFNTPSLNECIGYTVQLKDKVSDRLHKYSAEELAEMEMDDYLLAEQMAQAASYDETISRATEIIDISV